MALMLVEITPTANNMVITYDKYTEVDIDQEIEEDGVAFHRLGQLKELQTVLFAGPTCRACKKGDVIAFNPKHYAQKKYEENSIKNDIMENPVIKYMFRTIEIEGKECLFANEQDVDFVVNKSKVVKKPKKSVVLAPNTGIINPTNEIIKP